MAINVNSPHSGHPVTIREQDVGRAVRDEGGRIFYVLPQDDGQGYYGSKTRSGQQRESKPPENLESRTETAAPHDATGTKRTRRAGPLVVLILLLVAAALFYLFSPYGPYRGGGGDAAGNPPTSPPAHDEPVP